MYASTLPRSNWLRRASIRLAWYRRMPASSFVLLLLPLSHVGWTMQTVLYGIIANYLSPPAYSNTFACVVVSIGNRIPCSNLATLSQLHWLPVHNRIKFKIAWMIHTALYTRNPPPHIWPIGSSDTLHAELYGLPLPTFSLLLVVTSRLVIEVFARQLLLFEIVCPVTSVLAKLTFRVHL